MSLAIHHHVPGAGARAAGARVALAWLALMLLTACVPVASGPGAALVATPPQGVQELKVNAIPLAGPAAQADAEVSGLTWCADRLVLLPQYPSRTQNALPVLARSDLQAWLEGKTSGPLTPQLVPFQSEALVKKIGGFEGFESVVCAGSRLYFTIESHSLTGMRAYLVQGEIVGDWQAVNLPDQEPALIQAQKMLPNISDEAITLWGERLYTFYEANGAKVNPQAVTHVFDLDRKALGTLPLDSLEYRLTDATPADDQGRFWAMNYFYPGDVHLLPLETEPLAARFGRGSSHSQSKTVERMVRFQIQEDKVQLLDQAPLWLELQSGDTSRNWEGLALWPGQGFFIITDRYPQTLLAFIPFSAV